MKHEQAMRETVVTVKVTDAPDFTGPFAVRAVRPDTVTVTYWDQPMRRQHRVEVEGPQVKKDGTPSETRAKPAVDGFAPDPDWVAEIVNAYRPETPDGWTDHEKERRS